jgi:hypothetical protein
LVEWRKVEGALKPFMNGYEVAWAPQPGSQEAWLDCGIYEGLYEGTRGPGKTDCLLMDFAQHVGKSVCPGDHKGYGAEWRGILFRQTYPQLADLVAKTKKWFPRVFPAATFNESKMTWAWPTGETLRLSYMAREEDYWNYHGHSYPWIGWEELTTWPSDHCYKIMMSCSRSTQPGMPRKYRATSNPYGPGHNWVKARWRLPLAPGRIIGPVIREGDLPPRVAIRGRLTENRILLEADPEYIDRIRAAARNPSELKAWLYGSWDIVAGGMFDDIWQPRYHVVENIPLDAIPSTWRLNRSYDHGQSKPFSVGWWAQSNGEPIEVNGAVFGHVPGDLFRLTEWYGWNGSPNEGLRMLSTEIADEIRERENRWGLNGHVKPGPADSSIFDDFEPGKSVAGDMARRGVRWQAADKRAGSRKQGWEQIRKYLKGAVPGEEGVRESPGLFICRNCEQFIRTFPVLPRDGKDPDDVDTDAEDHIADEVRYRVREKVRTARSYDA